MNKFVFTLLLLIVTLPSFGYFYHIEDMNSAPEDHTIHLLSDCHGLIGIYPDQKEHQDKKNASDLQRMVLLNTAKRMNGCIIVEDMPFNNKAADCQLFAKCSEIIKTDFNSNICSFNSNKKCVDFLPSVSLICADKTGLLTPLPLLTQYCHQQSIPADNIEFRFYNDEYKISDLIKYYNHNLLEIRGYNDSPQLNAIYAEKIKDFESKHEKWAKLLHDSISIIGPDATMAHVISREDIILFNYGIGDRKPGYANGIECMTRTFEKLNYFNMHDTSLIDLRILHSIYNQKANHKNIFICAGADHIVNVKNYLSRLGYISKRESGKMPEVTDQNIVPEVNLDSYFKS